MSKLVEWMVNVFGIFLAKVPHKVFLAFVDSIAWLMKKLDKRRFKDAIANLDLAYNHSLDLEQKKRLINRCYRNFAFILLEGIRVIHIPKQIYQSRFEFIDEHYLKDSLAADKSVVLMGGHFGYWEAMATAIPVRYPEYNLASLGRLTNFEAINRLIINRREACGVRFIDKKGAFKHLLKLYSKGNTMTGILLDQNISIDEGVWVKFFEKEATHTTIASILSRRFQINIVPIFIDFNDDYSRFQVRFYPPIRTKITQDSKADIQEATQAQADIMQKVITQNPSSWFWFHKRWKSKYSEIYRH